MTKWPLRFPFSLSLYVLYYREREPPLSTYNVVTSVQYYVWSASLLRRYVERDEKALANRRILREVVDNKKVYY